MPSLLDTTVTRSRCPALATRWALMDNGGASVTMSPPGGGTSCAPRAIQALGLKDGDSIVRIRLAHDNTAGEVD